MARPRQSKQKSRDFFFEAAEAVRNVEAEQKNDAILVDCGPKLCGWGEKNLKTALECGSAKRCSARDAHYSPKLLFEAAGLCFSYRRRPFSIYGSTIWLCGSPSSLLFCTPFLALQIFWIDVQSSNFIYSLHSQMVLKYRLEDYADSPLRAKRATITFWMDKSKLKMTRMVHFGEFLKNWSLRSNSVTRQVSFKRAKIGGKFQN